MHRRARHARDIYISRKKKLASLVILCQLKVTVDNKRSRERVVESEGCSLCMVNYAAGSWVYSKFFLVVH
jgi:hypothetical protein